MHQHKTLRIAVVQFRRNRSDPEDNLTRMREIVESARGVDALMMPEAWRGPKIVEQGEMDEMLAEWGEAAAREKMAIITGGLFTRTGGDVVKDVCHVIGPDGRVLSETEKIFPSLPVGERAFVNPGDKIPIVEIAGVKVGILICVDLFYPELARSLALRGAEVILNPANIPEARLPLWHSLLSIRAGENTVFTVFTNNTRTTYPDNRRVNGGGAAYSPYGVMLFDAGPEPGVHTLELDMAETAKIRHRWPYLEDIRSIASASGERVVRVDEKR